MTPPGRRAILRSVWTGLVLAGGQASRMGRDKALVRLCGRTLLERAVQAVRRAGGAPLIVGARRPAAGVEDVRWEDESDGTGERAGPLPALRHGLTSCGTRVAVALACDLPLVPAALLRFMAAEANGHDAVVPRAAGEMQVLAAAYTVACLPAMTRHLASGSGSVHGFLGAVDCRILEGDELRRFGGEEMFLNVNTPDDLARAGSILAAQGP